MKGNVFTEKLSGKLGESVFYTLNGKQIIRGYCRNPHNPRTTNQMERRVQMANLMETYRRLKPFFKGAFEDRPAHLHDCNMLLKLNFGHSPVYQNKKESACGALVVAPYLISHGSLPSIDLEAKGDRLVSSLVFPKGFTITDTTTVGEVTCALYGSSCQTVQPLDRFQIVYLRQQVRVKAKVEEDNEEEVEERLLDANLQIYEFLLDGRSRVPFRLVIPGELFDVTDGRLGTMPGLADGAVAYVIRRETEKKTLVSTQRLVLTPGNTLYNEFSSLKKLKEAAESYREEGYVRVNLRPKIGVADKPEEEEKAKKPDPDTPSPKKAVEVAPPAAEVVPEPVSVEVAPKDRVPEPEEPRKPVGGLAGWFSEPSVTLPIQVVYRVRGSGQAKIERNPV